MARTEFDHDQFDEAYPPGIERSWWSRARNLVITQAFRRHVPRDARVLEVGCGTGIVTAHLRAAGWEVTGADLGDPRAGVAAPGHVLTNTDVLALPEELRATFTALVLFDVIEHIEDASGFLRALLAAYPNAKQVIVTVPARQELWTSFDDHYGHFRRYDRTGLRETFSKAGLEPVRAAYFFHALYPAIALNNLVRGRQRNIRFVPPAPGFASWANAVVASLFAVEARVVPGFVPGSSILGVARRR